MRNIEDKNIFINEIIDSFHILKTKQLYIILQKIYGMNRKESHDLLVTLQLQGRLLLSDDGYVLSKGYYRIISGDKFCDTYMWNGVNRLP